MPKKIAFACDHRGYEIKKPILDYLKSKKYEVIDCGTDSADSVDYPDFMVAAAEKVRDGVCERAIGACYSGIGSTIAANKVCGVRAALVHNVKQAELSRAHNDANMLILGSAFMDPKELIATIEKWLTTPFEGGRHENRVNKIKQYEEQKSATGRRPAGRG